MSGVWSATPSGPSEGLWSYLSWFLPLTLPDLQGTAELALRAGYRPSVPVPLALDDLAAIGTLGYRRSVPVGLRYGDGLYALERLTIEPRARLWFDGAFGAGADLSLYADLVLLYGGPVSVGGTLGYAQGWWYRLGLRVGL